MKRIVILGSSAASAEIIEDIRLRDNSSAVTLIPFDGHYPYRRDMFSPLIAKDITPERVFVQTKNFYTQNRANVLFNSRVSRINTKRRIIFTEDRQQIDYDILVITDTPENRFPEIKGATKAGVLGFKKLKDIEQILRDMALIDTAAILSDSFSGLQTAAAFAKRGKDVLLISSADNFLSSHFEDDAAQWLADRFKAVGIHIMYGSSLSEILGDKDAKAVRLDSGKVFSAELILFAEMVEDLRLFSESGLHMGTKIYVNQYFRTNMENIFALDQVCAVENFLESPPGARLMDIREPVLSFSALQEQAKIAAAAIYGEERPDLPLTSTRELSVKGLNIAVIGQTDSGGDVKIQRVFDKNNDQHRAFYIKDSCLIGAVLVNTVEEKNELEKAIAEKRCPELIDK